jgi:hypothetical protein
MNCSNCNTPNKDTAHFCKGCGAKLFVPEIQKAPTIANAGGAVTPVLPKEKAAPATESPEVAASFSTAPTPYPLPMPEESADRSTRSMFVLLLWIHAGLLMSYLLQHFIIPKYYNSDGAMADKLSQYAICIVEGMTLLLLLAAVIKVWSNALKSGLFIFFLIRAGIDCMEYTNLRKWVTGTSTAAAGEYSSDAAARQGRRSTSGDHEMTPHQAGVPYKIAAIKGYMYYNSNNDMAEKKVIGQLSDNIVDNKKIALWNTFIGEGSAEGVSNQTLIVVDVTGFPKDYTTRKIRLTATTDGGQIFKQTQELVVLSRDGKYKAAFLLYETGGVPVTLKAQIINEDTGKEIIESTMTKTIEFESGE